MQKPFLIGIAGGTGCGKTTVTERIVSTVGADRVTVIVQDNYYRDQAHMDFEERLQTNYDHPAAFDWELLFRHLDALMNGVGIDMPTYDFVAYTRAAETIHLKPSPVLVLDGIFALYEEKIRDLMGLKIFVDADADVRFIRRMLRDTEERGRTVKSVIDQYMDYVRPMHLQFIEPTKRYADVIIPHGGHNEPALEMLSARIRSLGQS
ncbi:uridine kinase [Deinococcus cellulosilyticus]|uniref:Uridine kinase n=1 Tax=Deinococcus cellulosilyticus (strain DSM 18568 / NBRC 106333 / KACC 11606 / 5516J-15) TaxID=1223518 RepID=A0A511MZW3_DEIC1|nr:uridine kinase [Deinococcus cellulosilyticus]GEM45737.1 uridine kinase [Deinococcus cellulosilyticus NBRC 106333 = KACC 11606]